MSSTQGQQVGGTSFSYYNQEGSAYEGSNFETNPNKHEFYEKYGGEFVPPEHKYIEHEKFGSAFFKDNNEEEYAIQRAFQPGNFTYLRKMPDQFQRNCILNGRLDRVKDQLE